MSSASSSSKQQAVTMNNNANETSSMSNDNPKMASSPPPKATTTRERIGPATPSSDCLADRFSSSLASIVTRTSRRLVDEDRAKRTLGEHMSAASDTSSSTSGGNAHSSSGGCHGEGAVITASAGGNTNSSGSGEDRDSSGGNGSGSSGSGSGQQQQITTGHHHHHHHSMHADGGEREKSSVMRHHHHHSHHRQRQRRSQHSQSKEASTNNDDYGLPVPRDDRLVRETDTGGPATVVAKLPPPSADSGSSGAEVEQHPEKKDNHNTAAAVSASLLVPHHEPAFHTIRRTFKKLPGRTVSSRATNNHNKSSETDSSGDQQQPKARKKCAKRSTGSASKSKDSKSRSRGPPLDSVNLDSTTDGGDGGGSGSSSGSGTEGGYAGSASSNEPQKDGSAGSSSSETASSGGSENGRAVGPEGFAFNTSPSNSPSLSSSGEGSSDDQEDGRDDGGYVVSSRASESPAKKPLATSVEQASSSGRRKRMRDESYQKEDRKMQASACWEVVTHQVSRGTSCNSSEVKRNHPSPLQRRKDSNSSSDSGCAVVQRRHRRAAAQSKVDDTKHRRKSNLEDRKPPILMPGCDVMAHILTFLEPPEILDVLTMPLSKEWQNTFTRQHELWRVLCLLEPFKAKVDNNDSNDEDSCNSSDASISSFSASTSERPKALGKYRLLYSSFVRCMKYLARIKDDAQNGRPPSCIDYGDSNVTQHDIGANRSLNSFLANARGIVRRHGGGSDSSENNDEPSRMDSSSSAAKRSRTENIPVGVADDRRRGSFSTSVERVRKRKKSPKTRINKRHKLPGASQLTNNLLGPGPGGEINPASVELPWSCAIYSIVNWMVAFSDVEGIQIMFLKVLPLILEDERQRMTAQRAGLTDVILRAMVLFPNSVQLHTVSFHTIVLLARPLGGREGMLFHSSMVNSSGIFSGRTTPTGMFSGGTQNGKNGIAVMLDSMRRFVDDENLQAMSCWSLVNIALAPVQKEVLVKLGGIEVTANAMMRHPHNPEVQFRALFALINLVIPSVSLGEGTEQEDLAGVSGSSTEEEVLDETVGQVVDLVVLAMKNFCSSESILNRACLVLHNLSLTAAYHNTLLWTPNCYQMLEWCLANYPNDQVLQQSAAGTLHRLQVTLSNDDNLRTRFAASLQAQQRESLEEAHREAIHIHEQQQHVLQQQQHQQQRQRQQQQEQQDVPAAAAPPPPS